jgi:hypothetical protein
MHAINAGTAPFSEVAHRLSPADVRGVNLPLAHRPSMHSTRKRGREAVPKHYRRCGTLVEQPKKGRCARA